MVGKGHQSYTEYLTACRASGVGSVSYKERPILLAYLTGQTESSPHVEHDQEVEEAAPSEAVAAPTESPLSRLLKPLSLTPEQREARDAHAARLRTSGSALSPAPTPAPAPAADRVATLEAEGLTPEMMQRIRQKRAAATKRLPGTGTGSALDDLESALEGAEGPPGQWRAAAHALVVALAELEAPSLPLSAALHAPQARFEALAQGVQEMLRREEMEKRNEAKSSYQMARQQVKSQVAGGLDKTLYMEGGIDTTHIDTNLSFFETPAPALPLPEPHLSPQPGSARKRRAEEAPSAPQSASKRARSEPPTLPPIVVVPDKAHLTLLSMFNAAEWLQAGHVLRPPPPGPTQSLPAQLTIERPDGRGRVQLVSQVRDFKAADWERVVAVFVHGAAWQFKGWRWDTPAELFGKVRGFYLRYEDEKTPPEVKKWNVKELTVQRAGRHADAKAATLFWADVDEALRLRTAKKQT